MRKHPVLDGVILDVSLEDGSSAPVARVLREAGVTFRFMTAHATLGPLGANATEIASGVPLVPKPVWSPTLHEAIEQILR